MRSERDNSKKIGKYEIINKNEFKEKMCRNKSKYIINLKSSEKTLDKISV